MNRKKLLAMLALGAILFSPSTSTAEEIVRIDLEGSIARALQYNRDIEQSQKDRDIAKWAHSQARRQMGPRLSWSASAMHLGGNDYNNSRRAHEILGSIYGNRYPSYDNEFMNSVSLEMPLYTGGQQESQIGSTRYRINYADLTLENTRQEIKYQTTAAYYGILQKKALMKVEEEAVNLLQEHLNRVNLQYEVGTVAKSDVLSSKVQLASRKQSLVTANGEYINAIEDLNNLIGLEVGTVLEVNDELRYEKYNRSLAECLDYALKNRPDGVASDYALKQAELNLKGAKSGYRPNFTAVIEKTISGEGSFTQNHSESWNAGVRMSWGVFDNGVTSAQAHEAKAELEKIQSQTLQIRERIKLEVSKAYTDLISAEKNISITSEAIKMAEDDYFIAQMRYVEGIDTNLSVMDAQEKLTEAQTNYYNALYSYNIACAALNKAIGIPVNINVPLYVETEKITKSSDKALKKSEIN